MEEREKDGVVNNGGDTRKVTDGTGSRRDSLQEEEK